MLQTQTISVREVLRNYKHVISLVKDKKQRITIVSQNKPQVGIVSLADIKKLEQLEQEERNQESTKSLLDVAEKIRDILKDEDLPPDLSTRHDYYHYEEDTSK